MISKPPNGLKSSARVIDFIGRWVVTASGIGVIAVVLGIFVFIFLEAYPLFLDARVEKLKTVKISNQGKILSVGIGPYQEIAFVVTSKGINFIKLKTGKIFQREQPFGEREIVSAYKSNIGNYLGLGMDDGDVVIARVVFFVKYSTGVRKVTPEFLVESEIEMDWRGGPISSVSYRNNGFGVATVMGVASSGRVLMVALEQEKGLLGAERIKMVIHDLTEDLEGFPKALITDGEGRIVLVGTDRGEIFRWEVSNPQIKPKLVQRFQASQSTITSIEFLLGDVSIVVGDAGGKVSTWLPVRQLDGSSFQPFQKVHELLSHSAAVTAIAPSARDKQFLTGDAAGQVALHHLTSTQTFFSLGMGEEKVLSLVMAPKTNGFLCVNQIGRLEHYRLENPHPEVTFKTLFGKVWYEGYGGPEFVWQSTGGSDDFEPKLGLYPLIFGTAKGTFYAMFLALPLAVMAAIYTSEFARPEIRNVVKSTVEIMASLPSVILGFLAALWLAPLLEEELLGGILLFPLVPTVLIVACWGWWKLPYWIVSRISEQGKFFLVMGMVLIGFWMGFALAPVVEKNFFDGNFQDWLRASGLRYDQRNCLVVGIAMGFAVIPIIYTICEDALSSVPPHLRAASLALGATPWQTAVRVVLPTASPGIFSATMIGFGRAVGETMIVLMATGNTPILDWNIFNGMRTMSANIAVEIPEAPHEGTLYRVLFLTGLLLAAATFFVNTLAEVVRQRLRERYNQI